MGLAAISATVSRTPLVSLCSGTSPARMASIRTRMVARSVNVRLQQTHEKAWCARVTLSVRTANAYDRVVTHAKAWSVSTIRYVQMGFAFAQMIKSKISQGRAAKPLGLIVPEFVVVPQFWIAPVSVVATQ